MAIPDRIENKEAIEAAKAEILAAIAQTDKKIDGCVTAQTKTFTETVFIERTVARENKETDFITIEGRGRALILTSSSVPPGTIVDGVEVIGYVSNIGVDSYEVYFGESLVLKNADTGHTTYKIRAIIQT